jgi:hypothetical protein
VAAIWLSPFYRSPMADSGYDIHDDLRAARHPVAEMAPNFSSGPVPLGLRGEAGVPARRP